MEGLHRTISLPPRLAYAMTIPNCSKEVFRKWYPVAFVMCIFWIAVLSYFISWTITIIGEIYIDFLLYILSMKIFTLNFFFYFQGTPCQFQIV